jgi:hypothetical protein
MLLLDLHFGLFLFYLFIYLWSPDLWRSKCGIYVHWLSHVFLYNVCWEYVVTTCRVTRDATRGLCKLKLLCQCHLCSSRRISPFPGWRPQLVPKSVKPLATVVWCADNWSCPNTPCSDSRWSLSVAAGRFDLIAKQHCIVDLTVPVTYFFSHLCVGMLATCIMFFFWDSCTMGAV